MSVLPKLLSVLVLVAARGAVAALNVPVGVQSCVCGLDAALEGVYPFTPCTGDGADVFRPQMAGGPGPLASDVVAWWDHIHLRSDDGEGLSRVPSVVVSDPLSPVADRRERT